MKRLLKLTALVVALLLLIVVAVVASAFLGRRSVPDTFELNGIRIVKDGFVSVAVLPIGEREVALIDAGNDSSGKAVVDELSRRGLGPDAVSAILITHGHPDHIAGIAAFPKAQVVALDQEVALIEGRVGARGPLQRLFPVKPTGVKVHRSLRDGETMTLGQTQVRAFSVPGHTAGSTVYVINETLFLGDAADVGRNGAFQGAPWVFSDSQAEDRASLVRLYDRLVREGVVVRAMIFAHSGALTDGIAPLATFARSSP